MEIDYLEDDTVSAREYSNLMSLYVKQMEKTASLQDENTALHNMILNCRINKLIDCGKLEK